MGREVTLKFCKGECQDWLPTTAFNQNAIYKDKLHIKCKVCSADLLRKHRKTKPELHRFYEDRRHANNPKLRLMSHSKLRARQKGLEHTITYDDIVIPEVCPYLGIPLQRGKGKVQPGSPTLDRIDNTKGYIPGNIEVISFKANTIKSNATLEELNAIIKRLNMLQLQDVEQTNA